MAVSTYNQTLTDAVITVTQGGLDDGAFTTAGTAVTACINSMTINHRGTTVDVSCAQDLTEFHRVVKRGFTISITAPIGNAEFDGLDDVGGLFYESFQRDSGGAPPPTNTVFQVDVTIGGDTITYIAVLGDFDVNLDEPPTWSAQLLSYGVAPTI